MTTRGSSWTTGTWLPKTFGAVIAGIGLLLGGPVHAQAGSEFRMGPDDPVEVEAFIDGLMAAHLEELDTAGATVSIVKNGQLFFAKGYGYADAAARKPVDAAETLFRIGSVSKLFVWLSVMQLVEEGKLELDVDINRYLTDFQIPDTFPEPVTLAHLMTHTPGFEDWVVGLFGTGEETIRPLAEILGEQIPTRVRPPGEAASYSNHGTGMAAYIVEQVSGQDWQQFVQERILDPLGMTHTSFAQPLPPELMDNMSKGYVKGADRFIEQEFEWVPLAPAGAAASTATDMARFMIATLHLGLYGEARIVHEETALRMREPLVPLDPRVNPMRHGFMDVSRGPIRVIGHGGSTFFFQSWLALYPDYDVGVFVSYNSENGSPGRFLEAFNERYFPQPARRLTPPDDFAERSKLYTGAFRANRYSHSTLAKLAALASPIEVRADGDGELLALNRRFVEVADGTFLERGGTWKLVFLGDENAGYDRFYIAHMPIMAFDRVPTSESPGLHTFLLVVASLFSIGTLIAWPAGWITRRWFRVQQRMGDRIPMQGRLVLWVTALVVAIFLIGMAVSLSEPEAIALGDLSSLAALLTLPFVALALTIVSGYFGWRAWQRRLGTQTGRLFYTATVLFFLIFFWQLSVWNLLGFRF